LAVDLLTPPPKTRQNRRLSLRITSHTAELARHVLELALEGIDP
jgi:hypothetical protein